MAFETAPDHDADDLAWLAFGYATGGLGADASASFERRLDADQSAREALAAAVLLSGSVALAARAERRGSAARLASAFALAAAACLALAVAPRLSAPAPAPGVATAPAPAPATVNAGNGAVALAWSGLRHEAEPAGPGVNGSDPDDPIDRLAEPDDAPPHWLLEAAALPPPDAGRGS